MTDLYDQWRRWLAGQDNREYVRGLKCGFYRARYGASDEWKPLAIFEKDGELVGLFLGELYTEDELLNEIEIWPRAARHPISETLYREIAENGGSWPPRKPK